MKIVSTVGQLGGKMGLELQLPEKEEDKQRAREDTVRKVEGAHLNIKTQRRCLLWEEFGTQG